MFLDKALFTTYVVNPTSREDPKDDEELEVPPFEISLSSLLETLQIFGVNDNPTRDRFASRERSGHSVFENRNVLGVGGLCRLSYEAVGDSFRIILEESGLTTAAQLTTYAPTYFEEIPLQKDNIVQKIIMRASWLHDAVLELSSTSPTRLTIASSPQTPHFTLSSIGPLGSAMVEFSKDPQLLETFQVASRTSNTYKYSLVKSASRAMSAATKVSIRTDVQGVLSLQFMIQTEHKGKGSGFAFVDFRFIPYIDEEDEDDDESQANAMDTQE